MDTSLINITTPDNFSLSFIVNTLNGVTQNQTLFFDFFPAISTHLSSPPFVAEEVKDWPIDINLLNPPKNQIETFVFNDTGKHLMSIYLIGNQSMSSFAKFTEFE